MKKLFIIVMVVLCAQQLSAQQLERKEILAGYDAILNEIPTIETIRNPIEIIDTLTYLEQVVNSISNANQFFRELQGFWLNAGIILCNSEEQGVVLKESKNNLFLAFYDTETRYQRILRGEEKYVATYDEDGIIHLPLPRGFKNLDILSILLVHETMHIVFGGGEMMPYWFESMALVQFKWGRHVMDELLKVANQGQVDLVDYYQQCEKHIEGYDGIEELALRGILYICPQLVANKMTTNEEFVEYFRVLF